MGVVVYVNGIKASGRHGADPGEQAQAQPFVVDVELLVDPRNDQLPETADYATVAEVVREAVSRTSFRLLESLAAELAHVAYGLENVERATVTVHKPNAAERLGVDDVAAEATVA